MSIKSKFIFQILVLKYKKALLNNDKKQSKYEENIAKFKYLLYNILEILCNRCVKPCFMIFNIEKIC